MVSTSCGFCDLWDPGPSYQPILRKVTCPESVENRSYPSDCQSWQAFCTNRLRTDLDLYKWSWCTNTCTSPWSMILKSIRFLKINLPSALLTPQPLPSSQYFKQSLPCLRLKKPSLKSPSTFPKKVKKVSRLDLRDNIYNWMVDFLLDRKHRTRYAG